MLNVGVATKDNYCDIALVHAKHEKTMTLGGRVDTGGITVVLLDAGDIAAIEDGYSETTLLRAKRGAKFLRFYQWGEALGGIDNMSRLYQAVLDTFPGEGFPGRRSDKSKEGVSANIRLITNESAVDKNKIYNALMDLSKACAQKR